MCATFIQSVIHYYTVGMKLLCTLVTTGDAGQMALISPYTSMSEKTDAEQGIIPKATPWFLLLRIILHVSLFVTP